MGTTSTKIADVKSINSGYPGGPTAERSGRLYIEENKALRVEILQDQKLRSVCISSREVIENGERLRGKSVPKERDGWERGDFC